MRFYEDFDEDEGFVDDEEPCPATEKQMNYATDIAEELGIDLPKKQNIETISDFISDNANEYYTSRRARLGGYGEMQDRIDKRARRELYGRSDK